MSTNESSHSSQAPEQNPRSSGRKTRTVVFIALLALVAVSIGLRLPGIGRPLSEPHDWITAQSLIALEILRTEGLTAHSFAIPQTYPGAANRHVRNAGIRLFDAEGVGYYTSFPPFSIILPHLVFQWSGVPLTPASLRLFGLVLHGLAGLFLFLVLKGEDRGNGMIGALAGCSVFLFLAPNLWYLSSTYSWDTFWHFVWAPWLVIALSVLECPKNPGRGRLALLGGLTFVLVYSEFIGVLCVAALAALLMARGVKRNRLTLLVVALGVVVPTVLTLAQYSILAGPERLWEALLYAFQERSFLMASPKSRPQMLELGSSSPYVLIGRNYLRWFGPVLVFIVAGALFAAFSGRWGGASNRILPREWRLITLAAAPIVIHHAVLVQWTARHAYSVVKVSFLLAVLTAMVCQRLLAARHGRRGWIGVALSFCLLGVLAHGVQRSQTDFILSKDPSRFARLGGDIANRVDANQVVFAISALSINPQVVYYAKRNIQTVRTMDEARAWLAKHDRSTAVLLEIDRIPCVTSTLEVRP